MAEAASIDIPRARVSLGVLFAHSHLRRCGLRTIALAARRLDRFLSFNACYVINRFFCALGAAAEGSAQEGAFSV